MEEIRNTVELNQEEIDAAIEQIKNSQEYIEMEAAWAKLLAQLAANGLDVESIQKEIELDRQALADIQNRLDQLEQSLGDQGMDPESLNQQIADKQTIIDLQADKIKSQADEIASLQKFIAELRSMPTSINIEDVLKKYPFAIGVAENTDTTRAQI